jgi:hypothetical protein
VKSNGRQGSPDGETLAACTVPVSSILFGQQAHRTILVRDPSGAAVRWTRAPIGILLQVNQRVQIDLQSDEHAGVV